VISKFLVIETPQRLFGTIKFLFFLITKILHSIKPNKITNSHAKSQNSTENPQILTQNPKNPTTKNSTIQIKLNLQAKPMKKSSKKHSFPENQHSHKKQVNSN
jgi:hypothetical protein